MDCSFYKVKVVEITSREIRGDRQRGASSDVRLPWCAHPHSPAPLTVVSRVIGGANLLQCGGDLDRCQVPVDKF